MPKQDSATILSFKPRQAVKKLLKALSPRSQEILERRYGLGNQTTHETLESIGASYGITRERVRQVENYSLANIRKSELFSEVQEAFDNLTEAVAKLGGVVSEDALLDALAKDDVEKNDIRFLLALGPVFQYQKEGKEFRSRWYVDAELREVVEKALNSLYKELSNDALVPEPDLIVHFFTLTEVPDQYKQEDIARTWLALSKQLDRNPLGEWGCADSPNVRAKGMRDYAYLAIKQHGSPMHFREVAKAIEELFNRKAHEATCHNELIKDKRFVLVGRGLYALSEWGYNTGIVRDVIRSILSEHGALSKQDIVEKVRNERYVKDNTIIVNLQDTNFFVRNPDGTYSLR